MKIGNRIATPLLAAAAVVVAAWGGTSIAPSVDEPAPGAATAPVPHETLFRSAGNFRVHVPQRQRMADLRCLALNIYWEARSEPVDGQIAVAQVTLNRVADPRFPDSVCDVVYQGGESRRHRCQFSWWCDGKKDDPKEAAAWRRATMLARLSAAGVVADPTDGALWYHADYVAPDWARHKEETTRIGRHIFYDLPSPGRVEVSENVPGL